MAENVPQWPLVRCEGCRHVWEVGPSPRVCPVCGGVEFVSMMDGAEAEITEPNEPGDHL